MQTGRGPTGVFGIDRDQQGAILAPEGSRLLNELSGQAALAVAPGICVRYGDLAKPQEGTDRPPMRGSLRGADRISYAGEVKMSTNPPASVQALLDAIYDPSAEILLGRLDALFHRALTRVGPAPPRANGLKASEARANWRQDMEREVLAILRAPD
jgi:hypothetical protein